MRQSKLRAHTLLPRFNHWLKAAGVTNAKTRASIAVDVVDAIEAAARIDASVRRMIACKPSTRRGADRALTHAGDIDALAFGELRSHVDSLRRTWERVVMGALARKAEKRARKRAAA